MMKLRILALPALLALAACAPSAPAPDAAATPGTEAPATPEPAAKPAGPTIDHNAVVPDAPEGITLPSELTKRRTELRTSSGGVSRNRVYYEVVGLDKRQAYDAVAKSLTDAGFEGGTVEVTPRDSLKNTFKKSGFGSVLVSSSADVGKKPNNPAAVGVIAIDWPKAGN